jgi:PBSX family phage terminase large subunit
VNKFKKTDIQKDATKILSSNSKFAALFGGSRSGKTFILVYSIIVRASKTKSRHAIVRLNFNAVKRSVFLDTFPKVVMLCFPGLPVKYNKTDYIAYLPNGSEIHFLGLDDGQRTEKVLGLEFSTLYINEASQVDYSSVQMLISRLAEKNDLKKRVWFDFNPPTKSHWSYYLFIKKLDPISDIPLDDPDNYVSLKMNPAQNIENIDSEYLTMLEKMPEKDRNRFLLGEFNDESDGQVYYAFRSDDHIKQTEIIAGTIHVGIDFNVSPFTAVIGQFYENKFFIHDEVYLENSDTFKMSDALKRKGYGGAVLIPDSTAHNRKTSGMSDVQILEQAGFKILSTRNPFVTDRVNNINRLFTANRIIINPKCKKLINDLHKVVWKDNKLDQSGTNKMLTHISDALGYLCWRLEPMSSFGKVMTQDR